MTRDAAISLERMRSDFNNPDPWVVTVRDQANVLSLIDVVEAADVLLGAYNDSDLQPFELWQRLAQALGRFRP